MDWRNYQFWRKKLLRVDENSTEFNLLVQRTIREIAIRERIRRSIQLLQGHPKILKKHLGGELNLEVLVIYEKIFSFVKNFDKKLDDPVWESVKMKINKYSPFININVFRYKKLLTEVISNGS